MEIYTLKQINNRIDELKLQGESPMAQEAVYYWLRHLQEIFINIQQTSLNDPDRRERLHSLAQKLIQ